MLDRDELPVLLAVSDNGPQMTSPATATFMAGARIAQHFGRPGTPNDQGLDREPVRPRQDRVPHLERSQTRASSKPNFDRIRVFYNEVRLHQDTGARCRWSSVLRARSPRRLLLAAGVLGVTRELLGELSGVGGTVLLYHDGSKGRPRAQRLLVDMNPTQHRPAGLCGIHHYAPTR